MVNKLGIVFCIILLICLIILSVVKAENITINQTGSEIRNITCQDLNCENFLWVENYIKNNLTNLNGDSSNFINLLKSANYGMQEDLNSCQKTRNNYKYLSLTFLGIIIVLILYILIFRIIKK